MKIFGWSQFCVHMRHPANLTICARIAYRTSLFSMHWQLHVNIDLYVDYLKRYYIAFAFRDKIYTVTCMMIEIIFYCVGILLGNTIRLLIVKFIHASLFQKSREKVRYILQWNNITLFFYRNTRCLLHALWALAGTCPLGSKCKFEKRNPWF